MKPSTKLKKAELDAIESRKTNIKNKLEMKTPYPPKSRNFSVGELVQYGTHPNAQILEVFDSGRAYEVKLWGDYKEYSTTIYKEFTYVVSWVDLLPLSALVPQETFINNSDIRLNYSNMMIDSMLSTYYTGIDMNPDYQRDYVWNEEDKVCLIDSIFNNRSIGTYILCFNGYDKELMYEILDGKQRVKAIVDFFEEKFTYNGKLYTELSQRDRNHFDGFCFPRATIERPTHEQKIKTFIHVNTTGKHMSLEHLEKVKGMLK